MPDFDEDAIYNQFPLGGEDFGIAQGFNTWVRINNPALFTEEALADPVISEFVKAPIEVTFAQFKSSYRESEYFIHKPVRAMTGGVETIKGTIEGLVNQGDPVIATLVINHERTLAKHITRALVITDNHNGTTGQMLHKEPEPPQEPSPEP